MFTLTLLACTQATRTEVDPTTPPPPTETALEFTPIGAMTVAAQFGYDPATGTASSVFIDGNEIPPSFEITFGRPGWSGSNADLVCTVAYDLSGLPITQPHDQLLNLTIPEDTPAASDCETLDPEEWGEDVSDTFRPAVFGVTVATALDHEVLTWLEDQDAPVEEFTGAIFHVEDAFGQDTDFAYASAFETDAHLALTLTAQNEPVPIASATLQPAPLAWYQVNAGVLWTVNP